MAVGLQRLRRADDVAPLFVLTKLGLADEARYCDFKPNDRRHHFVDERLRTITHSARSRLRRFVAFRQPSDEASKIALVVTHRHTSVRVRHDVVPRGHLTVMLVLARIPVGRDVCIWAAKHDKYLIA